MMQRKIYVIGGHKRHNNLVMPVAVYDTKDNVWERMIIETNSKRITVVAL